MGKDSDKQSKQVSDSDRKVTDSDREGAKSDSKGEQKQPKSAVAYSLFAKINFDRLSQVKPAPTVAQKPGTTPDKYSVVQGPKAAEPQPKRPAASDFFGGKDDAASFGPAKTKKNTV